jgi:hypothetical protein
MSHPPRRSVNVTDMPKETKHRILQAYKRARVSLF